MRIQRWIVLSLAAMLLSLATTAARSAVIVEDKGVFENNWYFRFGKGRLIELRTGATSYSVALHVWKEDLAAPAGKTRYLVGLYRDDVDRGWYGWGFLDLFVDGESVLNYPAMVTAAEGGPERGVVAVAWDAPKAKIVMEFSCVENGDNVMLEIRLEPREALESIRAHLLCYPGDYLSDRPAGRDRWIATAVREVQHQGPRVELDPAKEPWVFYFDKKIDPALTGKKHHASCALLYDPQEPEKVEVTVGTYSIETDLYYPSDTRSIHYVLWKFPGRANAEALAYMRSLLVEEKAGGE